MLALCLLHWVPNCIHDMSRVLVRSCADGAPQLVVTCFFLDISLCFHVSVERWLYRHVGLLTPPCFIIGNHINKDTPVLLVRCVQPPKYLQHLNIIGR